MFVLTGKYNAMILEVEGGGDDGDGDGTNFEIVTRAFGDVGDKNGKKSEAGIKKNSFQKILRMNCWKNKYLCVHSSWLSWFIIIFSLLAPDPQHWTKGF